LSQDSFALDLGVPAVAWEVLVVVLSDRTALRKEKDDSDQVDDESGTCTDPEIELSPSLASAFDQALEVPGDS